MNRSSKEELATDQLLNAVYVAAHHDGLEKDAVLDVILKSLSGVGST